MKPRIAITLELSAKGERHTNFLDLAYAECVERAGGLPLYFPSLFPPTFADEAMTMIDGLVLTGGADIHPFYYGEEISAPVVLSPRHPMAPRERSAERAQPPALPRAGGEDPGENGMMG